MTYPDIFTLPLASKTVLIIGNPASGKTTTANALATRWPEHGVLHTDDYGDKYGHEAGLYVLLDKIQGAKKPLIIEGVMGNRLLRKGAQTGRFYPDVVIELTVTREQVERVYRDERSLEKLKGVEVMCKALDTVLNGYKVLPNPRPPVWHTIENKY